MKYWAVVAGLAAWGAAGWAGADTLVLRTGQRIECRVKERGDQSVKVEFEGTELTYDAADVQAVEVASAPAAPIEVPMSAPAKAPEAVSGSAPAPRSRGAIDPDLGRILDDNIGLSRKYGPQMKRAMEARNRDLYLQASENYRREAAALMAKLQDVLNRRSATKSWTASQAQVQMDLVQERLNEASRILGDVPVGMCPAALNEQFGKKR